MNSKKIAIMLLLLPIAILSTAQHLLTDTLATRYYPASEELNASWKKIGFDDANWESVQGIHLFGYGDYSTVEVPKTTSLYIRSFFNIDTIENYKELVFTCDYDDGFVAYINGVEFARVNMGKVGTSTTFNQLADRSHELEVTRDYTYPVLGFYIDEAFIDSNFVEGQNVLAFEVHNDSLNGSDLGLVGILADFTHMPFQYGRAINNIMDFSHRYKKSVQLESTKLPIIKIESNEYGIPFKRIEVPATIEIINNYEGKFNTPDDAVEYSGNILIEQRGESSASFVKKSFDIELQDGSGKDTSVSLLGLPRESDWVLQGPFADKSQIRNALIYELGLKTGQWTPRVKFCEVILNGEYLGLYNLIEKIKRDSSRVNIGKLTETEISGNDLTGGYIFKYDKGSGGIQIVYPNTASLKPEQQDYITNFVKEYETVLKSNDGLDENLGYKKYIETQSLIDYTIIAELGKNCDSYLYSTYLYKDKDDRDGRIHFGPLWDFDLCFGNSIWQDGFKTEGWQFEYGGSNKFNTKRLFQDTELVDDFQARWFDLRTKFLHTDSLFARIDELSAELEEPLKRNYEVWPLIDEGIFYPAYTVYTYDEEIAYIKNWITARVAWMDENINNIYYPITVYTGVDDALAYENSQFSANVYPNPFSKEFYIDLNIPTTGNLQIEIINIQGKVVGVIENAHVEKGNYKVYWNKGSENLEEGLHLISIRIDGKLYDQIKVINIGN